MHTFILAHTVCIHSSYTHWSLTWTCHVSADSVVCVRACVSVCLSVCLCLCVMLGASSRVQHGGRSHGHVVEQTVSNFQCVPDVFLMCC